MKRFLMSGSSSCTIDASARPPTIIATTPAASAPRYGHTWRSRRRYSSRLVGCGALMPPLSVKEAPVEREVLAGHELRGEACDGVAGVRAHARGGRGVEPVEDVGEARDVERVAHEAAFVLHDHLRGAAMRGRHHGKAARHRLERRVRKRVVE